MPIQSKIPPALHAWVMQQAGEGKTGEEIAAALWAEHKIESSSRAVQRLLEKRAQERGAANEAVAREELRRHVIPAIRRMEYQAARAVRIALMSERRAKELRDPANENGHPHHPLAMKEDELQLKAGKTVLDCSSAILNYAGLNQPDKTPAKAVDIREQLLQRIKKLAAAEPVEPQVH